MVAPRIHAPARMTLTEFLSWEPEEDSGCTWQLVDGQAVAMAPGSESHTALQGEIGRLIGDYLVERGGPCRAA